jgi:two-component system nitrogen regulation response regulator GlnG
MLDADLSPGPTTTSRIVVVEDEPFIWDVIRRASRKESWTLSFANSAEEAEPLLFSRQGAPDLLITDLRLPGVSGIALLKRVHAADSTLPVLVMTAMGDVPTVVECMKAGAYHYITKPFRLEELFHHMRRALAVRSLVRRAAYSLSDDPLASLMGPSDAVLRISRLVDQVAPTDMAVLVEGESGTGKELVARRIHSRSRRNNGPLVAIDCGAIPESLIESELFGYKKGSFTGALADRVGLIEAATGGTLFLDEIGNLPLTHQARLLRALEQKAVTPLGGTRPQPVDLRIVSASNGSLREMVAKGRFRLDLYHRLAEFPVGIPPLRERPEDLVFLAMIFLGQMCDELGRRFEGFSDLALEQLLGHAWPGNARELRSAIRRAAVQSEGRIQAVPLESAGDLGSRGCSTVSCDGFTLIHLRTVLADEAIRNRSVPLAPIIKDLVKKAEREILARVLRGVGGNKSEAARILSVDYKTLHTKVKEYGIETDRKEPA